MLVETRGDPVFGYGNRPIVQMRELRLRAGARLGMFGPNGSGKTTLVRGLTGLLSPMRGKVIRRPGARVGYLPQHRAMELTWPMNGLDAASMALSARRRWGWVGRNKDPILEKMRLLEVDGLADLPMASLSGGQQQRVLLAGALAADPQLLVLDEPTEGLDVRSRRVLLGSLRDAAGGGLCTIMISHTIDDLVELCEQVAWIQTADDPAAPNHVEIVSPSALAERVAALQRVPA